MVFCSFVIFHIRSRVLSDFPTISWLPSWTGWGPNHCQVGPRSSPGSLLCGQNWKHPDFPGFCPHKSSTRQLHFVPPLYPLCTRHSKVFTSDCPTSKLCRWPKDLRSTLFKRRPDHTTIGYRRSGKLVLIEWHDTVLVGIPRSQITPGWNRLPYWLHGSPVTP